MIIFTSEGGFRRDPNTTDQPADDQALAGLRPERRNKYQILRAAGLLTGTVKGCLALRKQRNAANPPAGIVYGKYAGMAAIGRAKRSVKTAVPLGSRTGVLGVLDRVKAANPRLREWSLGQTAAILDTPWRFREIGSNSNWSKRSTFQRGIWVQSYATCTDFRVAVFHLDGAVHTITAPRGWRWDIDANGLRLRSCSDARIDYHPTASELIGDVAELPRLARAGWATRQAAKRAAKTDAAAVKRAEAIGVMVCLADSIRAGNCRAGSENFARNHGLDPAKHYTPAEVLAIANGQTRFVALACTAALRRTIRELDRGYSDLAEHRIN